MPDHCLLHPADRAVNTQDHAENRRPHLIDLARLSRVVLNWMNSAYTSYALSKGWLRTLLQFWHSTLPNFTASLRQLRRLYRSLPSRPRYSPSSLHIRRRMLALCRCSRLFATPPHHQQTPVWSRRMRSRSDRLADTGLVTR